jgi:hypothetical protein
MEMHVTMSQVTDTGGIGHLKYAYKEVRGMALET